ncbi:MAG: YlxR family protein [Chloroflexi bacterium]|nr:YlxR family protein [Chloroflexota bacterium]MYF23263.1 YlxR family protein [Chloroflexota bacterium]
MPMSARSSTPTSSRSPLRRCVSCRELAPGSALIRIARRPDGEIVIDSSADGRGAYLHRDSQCVAEAASDAQRLARALRHPLSESTLSSLAELADLP